MVEQSAAAPPMAVEPVAATSRPRGSRFSSTLRTILPPVVMFGLLIGVWYAASLRLAPNRRFLLPLPHDVLTKGLLNGDAFNQMAGSAWLTTQLALVGLLVAIVLGMALGLVMYRSRLIERASYPYLVALQAMPILAIAPLMTVAFGYGFMSKSIVCVIIAFFPIPTNLLLGMKAVDSGMVDLFRLQGTGWWTRTRKLALPASMPSLFAGFRISAGLSVVGAIVVELFFQKGKPGLGLRLVQYRQQIEFEKLYACLIWSSLLGIAVFVFFNWLGARVVRAWHPSAR
jgi:NitT/TauT family transport system permease protein